MHPTVTLSNRFPGAAASGYPLADRRNPADTEHVVARYPLSGPEDVDAAVEAARQAQRAWRAVTAPRRGEVLFRAQRVLEQRREELARALTLEEGKTLAESRGEVQKALNFLEFCAGEGRRLNGDTVPSEMPDTFCYTMRMPLGVVAVVTPWNFPVAIPVWKMAPALLCGNAVVWKPASNTPWTASIVSECFAQAGLPDGVLNLLYGSGGRVGDRLINHPDVAAVTFTGSNDVGNALATSATRLGKRVQCEMGGKNPLVVLDDADVELAAVATVQGAFGSTGQRCTATSRAIVMEGVADAFVKRVVDLARALVVGPGIEEGTMMGPSVDERQMQTVLDGIERAREQGAELRLGGGRLDGPRHGRGHFIAPTVFDRVEAGSDLGQEELFGPVLAVIRVRDPEEALEVANGVKYGLSSSIYTRDVGRVFRFVEGIETGITHVNSPTVGGEAQLPFGGVKATGLGPREMGQTAIEFYSELKTVYIDYTGAVRRTLIY